MRLRDFGGADRRALRSGNMHNAAAGWCAVLAKFQRRERYASVCANQRGSACGCPAPRFIEDVRWRSQMSEQAGEHSPMLLQVSPGSPDERVGDIVFVHGLDGDNRTTWQPKGQPDKFWPAMLSEDLTSTNIWSLGYDVHSLGWSGRAYDAFAYDAFGRSRDQHPLPTMVAGVRASSHTATHAMVFLTVA